MQPGNRPGYIGHFGELSLCRVCVTGATLKKRDQMRHIHLFVLSTSLYGETHEDPAVNKQCPAPVEPPPQSDAAKVSMSRPCWVL